MMRYLSLGMIFLLNACKTTLYPVPELSSIPWQYPTLSTTGCPDLTGIYQVGKGENDYHKDYFAFMTSEAVRDKSLHIIEVNLFEIKQQADGFNLKYWSEESHWGSSQQRSVFTKIDGVEFGCANNKLIRHLYTAYQGGNGGETPSNASILQHQELVITKLGNGDLDLQATFGDTARNLTKTYTYSSPKTTHTLIKRELR